MGMKDRDRQNARKAAKIAELKVQPHLRKPHELTESGAGGRRGNDPGPDIMDGLEQSAARADRRKQPYSCIEMGPGSDRLGPHVRSRTPVQA